jgi:L-lactate dehydrogenase complex protein LldG
MPAREHILHKVRTALGRSAGQPPAAPPPVRLAVPSMDPAERMRQMLERFPGEAFHAGSTENALRHIAGQLAGARAVASPSPLLDHLGVLSLPGVAVLKGEPATVREACAAAEIGITGVEFAMADTGALVVLASSRESRLASLLPLVHIAVVEASRILTGLDELFTLMPDPAAVSRSMVLIGGPSRTGDIEGILTLGVHGPREVRLVIV